MLKNGDIVSFGRYSQNLYGDSTPIQWIVLNINNEKALLLSRFAIDAKLYHSQYEEITWNNCSLRAWLNSEFYNTAFSDVEKMKICSTALNNDDSKACILYKTEQDPIHPNVYKPVTIPSQMESVPTQDYVFLLSSQEIDKYQGILKAGLNGLLCVPTDFAIEQGVLTQLIRWIDDKGIMSRDGISICQRWWLRNRIKSADCTACITHNSIGEFPAFFSEDVLLGVRPAIVVDLTSFDKNQLSVAATQTSFMEHIGLPIYTIRETMRKLDGHDLLLLGKKYKIKYCDQYGDIRLYMNSCNGFDPSMEDFIPVSELEKFMDCFPYSTPATYQELKSIYYFPEKDGTLNPRILFPQFDGEYLFKMYNLANLIVTLSKQ